MSDHGLVYQQLPERKHASVNVRYYLYESNLFNTDPHPVTGQPTPGMHTRVRQLRPSDRSITLLLNKPGSASFTVPITSADAAAIAGHQIDRCIVVLCDGANPGDDDIVLFSGPIWNYTLNGANETMQVNCVGWLQFLAGRELRLPYIFNQVDAGQIAKRLVTTANRQNANQNVLNDGATSAEDLLFGRGDLENELDIGFDGDWSTDPEISNEWAISGANSLKFVYSANSTGIVRVGEKFEVTPGKTYMVRGVVNITSRSGTAHTRIDVAYYNNSDVLIATDQGTQQNTVGVHDVIQTVVAPLGATKAAVHLVCAASAGGAITGYWDNLLCSENDVEIYPTPIEVDDLYVDYPANPPGADRIRTYQQDQKILNALEELAGVEAGFDFGVVIVKDNPSGQPGGETYRRFFRVWWQQVKSGANIYGRGSDRPDVVFSYRWMIPNLSDFTENSQVDSLSNRIKARGAVGVGMAQDMDSIRRYGIWEDTEQITDVGISAEILKAYAGAEVVYRCQPIKHWSPTPLPYDGTKKVPRFPVDYDLGDICYVVADHGALQVGTDPAIGKQPIRFFGVTINFDDADNMTVSNVQTSYSA